MIEIYDDALLRFFRAIQYKGKPLEVVFAGPDRAFGEMRNRIARRKNTKPELVKIEHIPLPFVSVFRGDLNHDLTRDSQATVRGILADPDSGDSYYSKMPRPFTSAVQADFWCKTHTHSNLLLTQLELLFGAGKRAYIDIDFGDERWYKGDHEVFSYAKWLGHQRAWLEDNGIGDNTDLEAGEGPKYIRKTFSGELAGVLPYPLLLGRLAKEVQTEVFLEGEDDPDDTITVS